MKDINIIYILPELKGVSGGGKVIYNHSNILNSLNNNTTSQILHVKKNLSYKLKISLSKRINIFNNSFIGWNGNEIKVSKNFKPSKSWFDKNIKLKKNIKFDPKKDFLILPEIFAHFATDLNLKKKKINYAIFVQGSYHMNTTDNFSKIKKSYEDANLVITTSDYSLKFLKGLYPKIKKNILKINLSIKKINGSKNKLNLITCMLRKLPSHYFLLLFYLKDKLPNKWKIEIIDNMTNKELYSKYLQSKIFLSFSHFEGFGLPPLEAALHGNKVIGYDGGGGKEYWKKPIFNKVEYGDIQYFGDLILREVNNYKHSWLKETSKQRNFLKKKYSFDNEKKALLKLSKKIRSFYN